MRLGVQEILASKPCSSNYWLYSNSLASMSKHARQWLQVPGHAPPKRSGERAQLAARVIGQRAGKPGSEQHEHRATLS